MAIAVFYIMVVFDGHAYTQEMLSLEHKFKVLPNADKRILMQISPIEGHIIANVLSIAKVERVVEIGTLFGYSAMWIASILPKSGILYTIDKSKEHCEIALKNYKNNYLDDKIIQINGLAMEELEKLSSKGLFDAVFIDAQKSEYLSYLTWAEKNVKKGGIIIADNIFMHGSIKYDEIKSNFSKSAVRVLKEFNKRVSNSELYDSFVVPLRDGLCFSVKKFF